MKTQIVGVVSCSKQKLGVPAKARTLYLGRSFKLGEEFCETFCDSWIILSAKYGVLLPDSRIEPYDCSIYDFTDEEFQIWKDLVQFQLKGAFQDRLVIFLAVAPALYVEGLQGWPTVHLTKGMQVIRQHILIHKLLAKVHSPARQKRTTLL